MPRKYLEPWIQIRSNQVVSECEKKYKGLYDKILSNINEIDSRVVLDGNTKALLLELEELLNEQTTSIATEVYCNAFNEAFDVAVSIYK